MLFDRNFNIRIFQNDGVDSRFCRYLFRKESLIVGVLYIPGESGRRNINSQFFAFSDDKGMLVKGKIHFDLRVRCIVIADIGNLIDVIAQTVIPLQ